MTTLRIAILTGLLCLPAVAGAEMPAMEQLDTNGDGGVDALEFQAAYPSMDFGLVDTDGSGLVDAGEWDAFKDAQNKMKELKDKAS